MAPGGIEPPHADSKSAALSTELRGLCGRVDEVRRSLSSGRGEKGGSEDAGRGRGGPSRAAANVRGEAGVRQAQLSVWPRRLVGEDVEARLDPAGDELAHERGLVDDLSPRRVDEAGAVTEK